jgi:hypothetical protein
MKIKIKLGSVVRIGDSNQNGYGVVINIFKIHSEQLQMAIFKDQPEIWDETKVAALMFSFIEPIDTGRWKNIGTIEIPLNVRNLSRRIDAGNLYIGEDLIRSATRDDEKCSPSMRVPYYGAFENMSNQIINNKKLSPASERIIRATRILFE